MPHSAAAQSIHDPLAVFAQLAMVAGTSRPVPLIATRFGVHIDGGLATVVTERAFRNAEEATIEVTMTFPVPVHATLFGLQARIGDRVVTGRAQRRQVARQTYEGAIDRGKTAVLHEEVLRGVHQVSVAHVPPGETVTVSGTWAMPLALVEGGAAALHIPVTVGDVYGRSPLSDSDDLLHGGAAQTAQVEVVCTQGTVGLVGTLLVDGRATVRLDAPIRLVVTGWRPGTLRASAADGRLVSLEITPATGGALPLDAAILVDRSGSMHQPAAGSWQGDGVHGRSKHDVLVAGLQEAAVLATRADRVDLWEFDDAAKRVNGRSLQTSITRLGKPRGGTDIGAAAAAVLAARPTRDVLLITDGKSHALDVQAIARSGRRFHVILIGEDSLEANVGHLAALSGGQVFVAAGVEAGHAVRQAIAAMRTPHVPSPAIEGAPVAVEACLAGMWVRAAWSEGETEVATGCARAVAAVAAALALPRLADAEAATLAEAEGIVCHLTSLVLVDEEGMTQAGLPAQRKVATMTPGVAYSHGMPEAFSAHLHVAGVAGMAGDEPVRMYFRETNAQGAGLEKRSIDLAMDVDWSSDPEALLRGDLSSLPSWLAELIRHAAKRPEVQALAASIGQPPLTVAIALVARTTQGADRGAARLVRKVLRGADPTLLAVAMRALRL